MLDKRCRTHFKSFGENPKFSPKQCFTIFVTSKLSNSFSKVLRCNAKGSICENQLADDNEVT